MHGISRSSVSKCTESDTKSICKTVENINFPISLFVLKSCLKKHDDYLKTYEYIKNAYCWQMAVLHSVVQPITGCIWTCWQAVFLVRWLFGMFSIIFKIQILDLLIQVTLNGTWKPYPSLQNFYKFTKINGYDSSFLSINYKFVFEDYLPECKYFKNCIC